MIFTVQCTCKVGVGIKILSVRPSVRNTRALRRKKLTVAISTSYEKTITPIFWHQQRLAGSVCFHLKFGFKMTNPLQKNAEFDCFDMLPLLVR